MDLQPNAKTIKLLRGKKKRERENLHNLRQATVSYMGYQKHKTNQK